MAARRPKPIDRFDPGWLFLVSGVALLVSTVVIPARSDLTEAEWQRDRALAIETERRERLFKHERYLVAVESREPAVVRALAASQLNLVPADRTTLRRFDDPANSSASVFPLLEPEPAVMPVLQETDSTLARLARGERSRLWMIAAGSMLVLIGLLPWARQDEPA